MILQCQALAALGCFTSAPGVPRAASFNICPRHRRAPAAGQRRRRTRRSHLTPQLRAIDIHFPRYGISTQDIRAFKNTLLTFQIHLPLRIGCIGILKDWLTRSLEDALSEKANTITIDILKRNAITSDQCEKIAAEALEGEASLSRRGETSTRLLEMLGFTKVSSSGTPAITLQAKEASENNTIKPKLPRSVGRRNATRDKVG